VILVNFGTMRLAVLVLLCTLATVFAATERRGPKFVNGAPRGRMASEINLENQGESDVFSFIADTILAHPVVIFSKSYCPYCKRAKALFDSKDIEFFAVEMDVVANGKNIQQALKEKTGQRTVPKILIGGRHSGGYDTLSKLSDEEINKLLEK
jgi:glutaredoxin